MVSPLQALIFLAMFLVLQQIEGNLIYPHVVGGSIGLPSIWVLVAITVGGNLMGVAGMIIFIPICSVLYALFALCHRKFSSIFFYFRLFRAHAFAFFCILRTREFSVKNRLAENNVSPEKWQEKAEFAEEVLLIKKDRQV